MNSPICKRCGKSIPTCEPVAYRGVCEDCFCSSAPGAHVGDRYALGSFGKWQKIDGLMQTVSDEGRATRDGKMK